MSKNYYWSLAILPKQVSVCLWTREDSETSILSFSKNVDVDGEKYTPSVDAALASITSQIPDDAGEPEKTVFGVLNGWVTEGHIKKDKLSVIREVCGELSLSPVGFVVFPEALAHYVKQDEGGPLSAVVIALNTEDIEVTIFKMGTPQGSISVGRSASLAEDVVEALSRFGLKDPLPSRFLIFGNTQENLVTASSDLSDADWGELVGDKITLLHNPKIEIVNNDDVLIAVSIAGSSEMGPVTKLTLPDKDEEISEDNANVSETSVTPNDLGFVMDADITKMGGVVEHDQASNDDYESFETNEDSSVSSIHSTRAPKIFRFKNKIVNSLKGFVSLPLALNRKKSKLPIEQPLVAHSFHRPRHHSRFKLIAVSVLGLVLVSLAIFAWIYFPKAEVTIFVSPRTLTSNDSFTLKDNISDPDISAKVLPEKLLTKTVSGSDTASATGVKVVGDKAKGTVTIRNGTGSDIKLPSGALLVSDNNLQFTLDNSASVSAAISPSEPGTATVAATASLIGADYNIAKDTSMKVGSFSKSEIDAVVASDFAGGTSRQISAVAKSDLDGLERSLLSKLTDQAKEELGGEASADEIFIPDSVTVSESSKSFDRKVGDEADSISLTLEVSATGVSIPKDSINKVAQGLLSSQVPNGFTFVASQTESSFVVQKGTGGNIVSLSLNAHLLPNIDPDSVATAIHGKTLTRSQEYLSSIPGFVRAAITISPSFPGPLKVLPWIAKHINVSIEAAR